jgi:hypothetical protein
MSEEKTKRTLHPPDPHEIIHILVTAIRMVKLYPPNNPVYSRSLKDAYTVLSRFLESETALNIGVQKSFFTCKQNPLGKETEANRSIVQDLFAKGIRGITFYAGLTEDEIQGFFETIAMLKEDIAMKSGVVAILMEKNVSNIKVVMAELDGVIRSEADSFEGVVKNTNSDETPKQNEAAFIRTLVLEDQLIDPDEFSANIAERARRTLGEHQTVEDRLVELYQETVDKIRQDHPEDNRKFFLSLAKSILSLEETLRDAIVFGKMYADIISKSIEGREAEGEEALPGRFHEVLTGQFASIIDVNQIADLLVQMMTEARNADAAVPSSPDDMISELLPADLPQIVSAISPLTCDDQEMLDVMIKTLSESHDTDVILKTLLSLLPLVKNPEHASPDATEIRQFDSVVRQVEGMLGDLLNQQDYKRVALVIKGLNIPVDPALNPRVMNALAKASSKQFIVSMIHDLHHHDEGSSEYESVYFYLSTMEQKSTEALLEMLADDSAERTPKEKNVLMKLLRGIGRNQISLLGEALHDERWHFVNGIINILSEIGSDEAIAALQEAVDNRNVKIKQDVIKTLIQIGGRRAAAILTQFFHSRDEAVQLSAIRGFGELKNIKTEDAKPLITFLQGRSLNKKALPVLLEAIKALGKTGGLSAIELLNTYTKFRWWKPWRYQKELQTAAQSALAELQRRKRNG